MFGCPIAVISDPKRLDPILLLSDPKGDWIQYHCYWIQSILRSNSSDILSKEIRSNIGDIGSNEIGSSEIGTNGSGCRIQSDWTLILLLVPIRLVIIALITDLIRMD